MGFISNAKSNVIAQQARAARQSGRRVFAAVLNTPMSQPNFSGDIPDWAAMIESIEMEGWQLTNWTVGTDEKGRPQAYPLFRAI